MIEEEGGSGRRRLSRRRLLRSSALGAVALVGGGTAWPAAAKRGDRAERAYRVRLAAAERQRREEAGHRANGDEAAVPGRAACYGKGLPHDRLGRVDAGAYELLLRALASGRPEDFERIPMGGRARLVNPQAAFGFCLTGPDAAALPSPPAPRLASAEQAAEMAELYWRALARDVPFAGYGSDPLIARAAEEMSRLPGYTGPRLDGRVTPETLFRGTSAGDLTGPYISQFLWRDVVLPPVRVEQRIRTTLPGLDYLTGFDRWLAVQNGALTEADRFEPRPRYLLTGRDLGEYVHRDFPFQAALGAGLILLKAGALGDAGNPYKHSRTQVGFTTFGPPYLLQLLAAANQAAFNVCWYQKWVVHRRLRPEELGGLVESHLQGNAPAPLDAALWETAALEEVRRTFGSALLPAAYPEGCPLHPSYPAGHAVAAGAGVTVLKAFFDESAVLPDPVVPTPDGLALTPWQGPPLTIGGELDKLAGNIAFGRDFAGVHWRSDGAEGLRLGEEVALAVLQEMKLTGSEMFSGYTIRRFSGQRVTL